MGKLLGMLVIVALIVGALVLSRGSDSANPRSASNAPAEAPGYAARNAVVIETDEDGEPLYTLNAVRVRQHPNDNRIQMDAPRMTYIASDGSPWNIRARSGQIRDGGANVQLFGDVHVNGKPPDATVPLVIDTSILSFDTKKEEVTTHAPVTLDWNGLKLGAVGLTANLMNQHVTLESSIHATSRTK